VLGSPSLFFQIASGLIPLLLAANGLTDALKPLQILRLFGRRGRYVIVAGLVVFIAAAVVAEFFAISEAVAGHFVPRTYRTTLVVDVIAVETALLGAAFLWPWIRPKRRSGQKLMAINLLSFVIAASAVGLWLLGDASNQASLRAADNASFCLLKADVEKQRSILDTRDRLDQYTARSEALSRKANRLRRMRPIPRDALSKTVSLRKSVQGAMELTRQYLISLVKLGTLGEANSFEDVLAQQGC
jgi:hypothetical protein